MQWTQDEYLITDDRASVQVDFLYQLLSTTYWSHKRPLDVIETMVDNSLCFSLYHDGDQIGFARAITDSITLSWLADIVIESKYQGKGLGKWLMECILEHPSVKGTQIVLQTLDAQGLYQKFGFSTSDALMSTSVDYLRD